MNFLGLGLPELILILVVLLLFFGKDKLPELARSIGKSVRELRAGFEKTADDLMPKEEKKKGEGSSSKP